MASRSLTVAAWILVALPGLLLCVGCHQPAAEQIPPQTVAAAARLSDTISVDDLKTTVTFLASDECAGRLTGTPGARRASQYIATAFSDAGLLTLPGFDGYYEPFDFAAGVRAAPKGNSLEVISAPDSASVGPCTMDEDFRPLAFSGNGSVEGDVVFVGYGLVEPQAAGHGYDSYANLDVKGKIVLALRYLPEEISPERRQELSLYAGERYKAKQAADRGAVAFLLVTGLNSPNPGAVIPLRESDRTDSLSIPAVSISGATADRLLAAGGTDLATAQTLLDGGEINPHAGSDLPGLRLRVETTLDHIRETCRNVAGIVPPSGGVEEYVLVGAHYDHLGHGEVTGSMAHKGEEGEIHNGADDNASGTSVVLELAAAFAEARRAADPNAPPRRGIIFACWSGEELGVIGSGRFAARPPIPLDRIKAYVNFDMVGRVQNNKLILQAVGSSPAWRPLIERRNVTAGFNLVLQNDPYLPTDSTTFYTQGIPSLAFFSDLHEDYHRPTDDVEQLNFPDLQRVALFARKLIEDVSAPDAQLAYARVERSTPVGERGGHRSYTGTVPDMAAGDIKGVRLADVRPGAPADKAGLKSGDVIIEFAGKEIANLQDYADALVGAKIGQPVGVVVLRDGQRVESTITPTARPD